MDPKSVWERLNLPHISNHIRQTITLLFGNSASSGEFRTVIERFRETELISLTHHSTRVSYESMLRRWIEPRWAHVPTENIKTADIEYWLASMDCAPKTRHHRKTLLHTLFNCAIRWELAAKNPVALVRVRGTTKQRRRHQVISLGELRRILEVLPQPWRRMVLLASLLGLRASEIMALQWGDFDFDRGTLLVERGSVLGRIAAAKTESSQELLPVHPELAAELLRYRAEAPSCGHDWLFFNPRTGKPYHQDSIRKRHLIPAGIAAGLERPLGWHTFRHSYRRWLDEAGTPMGIIKELMRHANISTTMDIYGCGRLTPAKRQAHELVAGSVFENRRTA